MQTTHSLITTWVREETKRIGKENTRERGKNGFKFYFNDKPIHIESSFDFIAGYECSESCHFSNYQCAMFNVALCVVWTSPTVLFFP